MYLFRCISKGGRALAVVGAAVNISGPLKKERLRTFLNGKYGC